MYNTSIAGITQHMRGIDMIGCQLLFLVITWNDPGMWKVLRFCCHFISKLMLVLGDAVWYPQAGYVSIVIPIHVDTKENNSSQPAIQLHIWREIE